MRVVRREAAVDPGRSAAIVERLARLAELANARTVMLFEPVPGEPDLRPLAERLRARGVTVVVPSPEPGAPHPIDPSAVDVVVVPGLAFTRAGDRLGQGGGWYDRFLAGVGPATAVVGVCFDEQLVDAVPTVSRDVPVRWLVTPSLVLGPRDA
jgi:5-formyltetrahydrofolate cyclo-ligase